MTTLADEVRDTVALSMAQTDRAMELVQEAIGEINLLIEQRNHWRDAYENLRDYAISNGLDVTARHSAADEALAKIGERS